MRFKEFILYESGLKSINVPDGRTGPEVADIQKVLLAIGYKLPVHGVDGIRGPETSAAIKQFQNDAGINADGVPGPETLAIINGLLKERPDLFNNISPSTDADVKGGGSSFGKVDLSVIQDPDFNSKLEKVASQLGIKPNALLAVMKQESGVNPAAVNRSSGATGLIQFMPDTARSLGTTTEALRKMSAVDQLDYVYMYYKGVGVQPGMDAGDLYVATFMPAALGKGDHHVLGRRGDSGFSGKVYAQNSGLDRNRDGTITVADIKNSVNRFA